MLDLYKKKRKNSSDDKEFDQIYET